MCSRSCADGLDGTREARNSSCRLLHVFFFSLADPGSFTATKARGFALPVHFKKVRRRLARCALSSHAASFQTLETANALRGMKLRRAQKFLENVKLQKEAVPFRNRNGGAGRHAQVGCVVVCLLGVI